MNTNKLFRKKTNWRRNGRTRIDLLQFTNVTSAWSCVP